ncbi:DUF3095 family protein [Halarcobacter ebronensis]|uniref:DUF3095 domain-containing protein n=1 Tax=Halarcobacter ebronensis TaxID=1462615 RepID=A0A4Q1AZJ6_9BACT|nr:DUF3095 family protein [Halarcobacter ebronensis]QKF82343.1 DUF3095 domain-containing protein [Halarcobacter ebronensis]RXK07628.1 hypothetical protein CRV07_03975 [Halarcobacter ebronensis]
MSNRTFFRDLKAINSFEKLYIDEVYKEVPSDWYLLASDIKNSTLKIEEGKYKEINMVGAMTIIAILNIDKTLDLPFVFGGDGAFLLIPKFIYEQSKQVLLALKELAKESYDLDLRVGLISLLELQKEKKSILVAKYSSNAEFSQALIRGEGLDYFDYLLKKDEKYHLKGKPKKDFSLDLQGLECRWQYIKSTKDESISLIFKCLNQDSYKDILNGIESIIGDVQSRHPLSIENLNLAFDSSNLSVEASIFSKTFLKKQIVLFKLRVINLLGSLLMGLKIGQWANYKKRIVQSADIQKFDNMVKMVFSTSYEKSEELENYLENKFKKSILVYGLHKSKYSLMTCLIFERHGKHIHFIDTSNGGYALAASALKKRLKNEKRENILNSGTNEQRGALE